MKIRIATRKSALALWQAEHVAERLRELDEVDTVLLVPMSTRGDKVLDRSLQKIGGKGLFIKELEIAMEAGQADIAVHSMKDVPAEMPEGFMIAAVLERANPADALVSRDGIEFDGLPEAARIGSSSLRRQAQIKMLRPDIFVEPLRGNVNTRLDKLDAGEFDAIVLAAAGLERLGMRDRITQSFLPHEMLPAAAQGVVGIECLEANGALRSVLAKLSDRDSERTTAAERAIAEVLSASCQSPVATYATLDGDDIAVSALVALPDGSDSMRESITGKADEAGKLGAELGQRLLDNGATELLARAEEMNA